MISQKAVGRMLSMTLQVTCVYLLEQKTWNEPVVLKKKATFPSTDIRTGPQTLKLLLYRTSVMMDGGSHITHIQSCVRPVHTNKRYVHGKNTRTHEQSFHCLGEQSCIDYVELKHAGEK